MKRFVSLGLVFAVVLTLLVPVSFAVESNLASSVQGVLYDNSFYTALDNKFSLLTNVDQGVTKVLLWNMMDKVVNSVGYGNKTSLASLQQACSAVNKYFSDAGGAIWNSFSQAQALYLQFAITNVFSKLSWTVSEHPDYGYVIVETGSGVTLCNSAGAFPYYKPATVTDPDTGAETEDTALGGKWVRIDKVSSYKNVVNEATLNDLVVGLVNAGEKVKMEVYQDKYKGIQSKTRYENGIPFVYCDSQSRQYVMQLDPDQWNVNNDHNIYIEDPDGDGVYDDGQTSNEQLIDVDNNTVWFPDGTLNFIETLIYDESTRTYYVDAHSEYNVTNNTYITNNYHYEYHINYTNVTYIGTTAEYDKLYEFYYELPDGRSSADLTAEELLALNADIDVVPYIRSADNTSLRFLYHFDGNTFDSSFWSYDTSFTWNEGASITYMDSGTFNGCLYLDENVHDFTITAPKAVGSQDFTLQWRMYNSYTAAPVTDSYVSFGGTKLLQFSGEYATFNGTQYATPVGNWYEVALIRENGTLRFYLNGIQVASKTQATNFLKDIVFHFGSEQQTYKQLDEMRFLNFPLVEGGADYTPTSVPYDTNLTLVL